MSQASLTLLGTFVLGISLIPHSPAQALAHSGSAAAPTWFFDPIIQYLSCVLSCLLALLMLKSFACSAKEISMSVPGPGGWQGCQTMGS